MYSEAATGDTVARILFAQGNQQDWHMPAITLDERDQFGVLRGGDADAVDDHVGHLVAMVGRVELPIDAAPIRVDWQLNPTNRGYKVTDVIVNGISMASAQHSDLVSVIQRNNGHMPALLVALREKNASNGILR